MRTQLQGAFSPTLPRQKRLNDQRLHASPRKKPDKKNNDRRRRAAAAGGGRRRKAESASSVEEIRALRIEKVRCPHSDRATLVSADGTCNSPCPPPPPQTPLTFHTLHRAPSANINSSPVRVCSGTNRPHHSGRLDASRMHTRFSAPIMRRSCSNSTRTCQMERSGLRCCSACALSVCRSPPGQACHNTLGVVIVAF